jgi:hypothetical protein
MVISLPLKTRVNAFLQLGEQLSNLEDEEKVQLFQKAENQNPWFVSESMSSALKGIIAMLKTEKVEHWLSAYYLHESVPSQDVGILMAGNIPAVGFHDLLCVLLSGHKASVKLSSSDSVFPLWLIQRILDIEPGFRQFIHVEEMLKGKDAYIATGSDNSARYFNYYFGKYPHVIRSNRTSVAILDGEESREDLENLGVDIFMYYGLGCRNVSKVFVKNVEILPKLLDALQKFEKVASHHKYFNNYEYNKSIYLVNREQHLDNGFLLLKESEELVSPIGVLFYEIYKNDTELDLKLASLESKLQCVLSRDTNKSNGTIPFGQAQCPDPWDYSDKVDTMAFLSSLS